MPLCICALLWSKSAPSGKETAIPHSLLCLNKITEQQSWVRNGRIPRIKRHRLPLFLLMLSFYWINVSQLDGCLWSISKILEWLFLTALFGFILAFKEKVLPSLSLNLSRSPTSHSIFLLWATGHYDISSWHVKKEDIQDLWTSLWMRRYTPFLNKIQYQKWTIDPMKCQLKYQWDSWWTMIRQCRYWYRNKPMVEVRKGFPGSAAGKESICNARDTGSIQGSGGSPGKWRDNLLWYSYVENPHGQRSLVGYNPWGHKEWDTTEWLSTAQYRG